MGWRATHSRSLPWELGHTGAFILADPTAGQPAAAAGPACAAAACLLAAVYLTSLLIGAGRTLRPSC